MKKNPLAKFMEWLFKLISFRSGNAQNSLGDKDNNLVKTSEHKSTVLAPEELKALDQIKDDLAQEIENLSNKEPNNFNGEDVLRKKLKLEAVQFAINNVFDSEGKVNKNFDIYEFIKDKKDVIKENIKYTEEHSEEIHNNKNNPSMRISVANTTPDITDKFFRRNIVSNMGSLRDGLNLLSKEISNLIDSEYLHVQKSLDFEKSINYREGDEPIRGKTIKPSELVNKFENELSNESNGYKGIKTFKPIEKLTEDEIYQEERKLYEAVDRSLYGAVDKNDAQINRRNEREYSRDDPNFEKRETSVRQRRTPSDDEFSF